MIPKLIKELLKENIRVTIYLIDNQVWYDLNTGTKSEVHVAMETPESVTIKTRYKEYGICEPSVVDIAEVVKENMCSRPYIDNAWKDLLKKYEIL